jgi:hypothetical protein
MTTEDKARDEAWATFTAPGQYVSSREADAWQAGWQAAQPVTVTAGRRQELRDLALSHLKPSTYSGGSWTLNPDALTDAFLAALGIEVAR